MPFDPSAATAPDSGVFGLPTDRKDARVVILPVPYEATTSYRPGAADGPDAIRIASAQVDLLDRRFGRIYEQGIFMEPVSERIRSLSDEIRALAAPLIAKGGATGDDADDVARIDGASKEVNAFVNEAVASILEEGRVPCVLGGDHASSFGAIKACSQAFGPIGVLQVDAHMDLRDAFEGFRWSHASIMFNVLREIPDLARIVQVGIRDYCEDELEFAERRDSAGGSMVRTYYADDLYDELSFGTPFHELCARIVEDLPRRVYLSVDIDGLDPTLCPNTGTPVPGGLDFNQLSALIQTLRDSDKQVVGFDLVEVAPGPDPERSWDAIVGARALYRLCALAPET